MKIDEMIKLSKLFDLYGKMLKSKHQEIMNLYLFKNLQIIEIAELKKTSKQSIFKIIDACSKKLKQIESDLGFCKKLERIKNVNKEILICWQVINEQIKNNKSFHNLQDKWLGLEQILKQMQGEL